MWVYQKKKKKKNSYYSIKVLTSIFKLAESFN